MIEKKILDFKMYLDPEDQGIGKELIEHGIRERFSVACMKEILTPDMNVLDLGANIGFYAFIEATRVKQVHAVEPVKYNFDLLTRNIELNKFDNISTYQLAIGGTTGLIKIFTSNRCNWATIVDDRHKTPDYIERWNRFKKGSEVVSICTLDDFIDKYQIGSPDLIRMDVEGAETEIIGAGIETINNMRAGSYLVIEIHSSCIKIKQSIDNMLDKIEKAGFVCVKVVNRLTEIDISKIENMRDFLVNKVGCPQVFFKKC